MTDKKLISESVGLYVHIPFCEAKCLYCSFYSEPLKNHDTTRLISAIISELNKKGVRNLFSLQYNSLKQAKEASVQNKRCQEPFFTIYIGGGSPSCLPGEELLRLVGEIALKSPNTEEFTVEINPRQVNREILRQLHSAGVNRLSIGAQSFDAGELKFLGRIHSVEDIYRAVEEAKKAGFENIGLDLIFAIPGSTLNSWEKTLQSAIKLDVQHISAYALTYEEGTPLQKAVEAGEIRPVDEETDRAMYETAIEMLESAGFKQYEISNFAKPGFECRHNLNYWANEPYIGVGPAAGSYWQGKRTLNIADIEKYIDAIEQGKETAAESEIPDKIQVACETAVLNLRRRCGIDLKEFKNRTTFDAKELFAEPISRYRNLGLIEITDGRLFLTDKALPIADSVLCDFSDV